MGEAALIRFYVLHVAVLPALVVLLDDGAFLASPQGWRPLAARVEAESRKNRAALVQHRRAAGAAPRWPRSGVHRTRLRADGSGHRQADLRDRRAGRGGGDGLLLSYAFFREGVALVATVITVMAVSLFWNAPLEEMANPAKTPNPAKAPWYFLGLQELVSHSALLGGVVVPGLMVLALLAIPYLDPNPSRRPADRKWAIRIFTAFVIANIVLIVIGTFFRGPGWALVPPWVHVAGVE